MKIELDNKLVNKYPVIFKDRHALMQNTCMCWGFEHDVGWYDLLDELCANIQQIMDKYNIDVTAAQVKEKFGGLRFYVYITDESPSILCWCEDKLSRWFFKHKLGVYYNKYVHFRQKLYKSPTEKVHLHIETTEYKSYDICEKCGKLGKLSDQGWLRTLCESCNKEKK